MALLSFFDKNVYCYVVKNQDRRFVYKYLLLILAISSVPAFYIINSNIHSYIKGPGQKVIEQIPEIDIKDGAIFTEASMPFIIKEPETDKALIIIDNTGEFTNIEGNDALIILNNDQLLIRTYENTTHRLDLSGFDDFKLNKSKIKDSIPLIKWVVLFMYVIYTLFLFTFYFILIHIYAWSGGFLDHFARSGLNYQAILRITVLAITPVLLIDMVLKIIMVHIPHWGMVSIIFSLSLIYFGLISNKNKKQSTDTGDAGNQTN